MIYEKAKKLKDAGFPQKEPNTSTGNLIELTSDIDDKPIGLMADEKIYIPTLSELIKACGDKVVLQKQRNYKYNGKKNVPLELYYFAGTDVSDCDREGCGGNIEDEVEGKTPEEAVANLWLELNKK